jgi:hypothetical protein
MRFEQDAQSADIWRAAQHRRTEDFAKWLGHCLERSEKMPGIEIRHPRLKLRLALARGIAIATITFVAVSSVSAVVHTNKSHHQVALSPIGPMPAVNVP